MGADYLFALAEGVIDLILLSFATAKSNKMDIFKVSALAESLFLVVLEEFALADGLPWVRWRNFCEKMIIFAKY